MRLPVCVPASTPGFPVTRDELLATATAAGVRVRARWTKDEIAAAIAASITAGDRLRSRIMADPTGQDRELLLRPDEAELVDQAAKVADTIAELEAVLAASPLMIEGSKGQQVVHPALAELRLHRVLLASLLGRLNLPEADTGDDQDRNPWDNLTASERARKAARAKWDRRGA